MSQPLPPDAAADDLHPDELCGWRCGHRRTATIGKALPVSVLLLNYHPSTGASLRARNSAAVCDDDIFYALDEVPPNQATAYTSHGDGSGDGDGDDEGRVSNLPPSPPQPPCLYCTGSAVALRLAETATAEPINALCRRLCTDACRSQLSLEGYAAPTRSEAAREVQAALAEIVDAQPNDGSALSLPPLAVLAPPPLPALPPPLSAQRRTASLRRQFLDDLLEDNDVERHKSNVDDDDDFREKIEIAEALARTTAMTSTSQMKRRLAARKMELDLENANHPSALWPWDDGGAGDGEGEGGEGTVATGSEQQQQQTTGENAPDNVAPETTTTTKKKKSDQHPPPSPSPLPVIDFNSNFDSEPPPRQLLLYLVRMGSFNSTPKINNVDSQDDDLHIPKGLSNNELLQHVQRQRGMNQPPLLSRYFCKPSIAAQMVANDITDGLRSLKLSAVSKDCMPVGTSPNRIRLLQWNILSQTLGQNNDGFVRCPEEALTWENRKFLIVQEILQNVPDIVCLQEVDHYKFLQNILGTQNYEGIFFPKPDSPCLYIEQNNGPDGCAIFFKRDKFELKSFDTRVLEVWQIQSNQVAIAANLMVKATGVEVCVCTTHLKARHGSLLSKLRNEQGRDLIRFVKQSAGERPVLLCGDFNAEPIEPVYTTILNCDILKLSSAYADINNARDECNNEHGQEADSKSVRAQGHNDRDEGDNEVQKSIEREPPYTTWKIREDGEVCHTIDYVFYSKDQLKVKNCLEFPQGDEIGKNRTPSFQYPSDHFSLVCDFEIIEKQEQKQKQMSGTQ